MRRWMAVLLCAGLILAGCSAGEREDEPDEDAQEYGTAEASPESVGEDEGEPEESAAPASPTPASGTAAAAVFSLDGRLAAGEYSILAENLSLAIGDRIHLDLRVSGNGKIEWGFLELGELPDSAQTRYYMGQREIDGEGVEVTYLGDGYQEIKDFVLPEALLLYVYNTGEGELVLEGEVRIESH